MGQRAVPEEGGNVLLKVELGRRTGFEAAESGEPGGFPLPEGLEDIVHDPVDLLGGRRSPDPCFLCEKVS